jgi:NADPH:quinone reductase-like Zn-dependent oxidoreductase
MQAIVWTQYGPPEGLQLQDVPQPTPRDHEILVKVHATTVTAGDTEMRSLKFPLILQIPMRLYAGLSKPTRIPILGQELAGEVAAVGQAVTQFKPGDQVFAATGPGFGAYAEYICLPEESDEGVVALKPPGMSYAEAAAVPFGGLEALHFLKKANIQPGERVVVNGAAGSIGTFGVQLAKYYGAEVTAVDSAEKHAMLRTIGADHVIDYRAQDFTRNGEQYDVIFDVMGTSAFRRGVQSLKPGGRYLLANPRLWQVIAGLGLRLTGSKRVIAQTAQRTRSDLLFLKKLIESGDIKTVIDTCYPLAQTAEAHRRAESGQKQGHIVITVVEPPVA